MNWLDWRLDERRQRLLDFVRTLIALRREQPALRRLRHFDAEPDGDDRRDVCWLTPQGDEMDGQAWRHPPVAALAMLLDGRRIGPLREGEPALAGDSVLVLVNRHHEAVDFMLPVRDGDAWRPRIDTATATGLPADSGTPARGTRRVGGRALAVLTQRAGVARGPSVP